ncbi:hypothetical protein EJB05_00296 [Eragrostis curvula]|uniref:Pentacotripeptide-repeat region of PRORP domain-containing protein n=1 Tax=Eragrostis curvula TaxID=38414 RepID=A0A5J9WM55_9POAL|nr:hypothetical protein EJB05_00296 [Eragrostis curvula]
MPFRPRLPLRLLLPHLRRRAPLSSAHMRMLLASSHASAAAAATESEEDTIVVRDASVGQPGGGGAGCGAAGRHWECQREENEKLDTKASIAARFRLCHELLWQRRWREMRGCLAEMVSEQGYDSAPTLCDILWNVFREWDSNGTIWDALANSYVRSQMIRDALYVLNQMNSLNMQISLSTYDSLLYSLRKTKIALEIYEEMESCGISPSEYSHSIIIDGLCKQDKIGEALSFLKEARKRGMFKPLGMTFNILMSALCKWGFIQFAKSFFGLMLKYGLNPDRYTYSTLIHGLCKVGSVEEALDICERVTKEGMELDKVTYNSLINGYRLIGLTREIPKMIKKMTHQGFEPDLVTYTILIAGLCEGGDVEEGLKIRKDLLDQGLQLNIVTYSVLLNALFKKGLCYEVESLLGEMCSSGMDMDVVAYSVLIHGYCKLGEIERALDVCSAMCDSQRVMPTSLNHLSILLALCKNRMLVEARLYLENVAIKYQPNDVALYNVVIDGYAKMGDISNAVQLFDQIVLNGMFPTIVTCNSLLYAYCKTGDMQMAASYFRAIQFSDLLPTAVTYTTFMDALSEAGEIQMMLSLFDEMRIKGIKPNAITYSVVIKGFCKQLRFSDAVRILDDMESKGVDADPITYNTLIQGFCEAQNIKKALEMHNRMVSRGLKATPVTYNLLINALCSKGRVIHAERLLELLRGNNTELRKFAYTTLIKAQCAKGMPHKAIVWVGKLIDAGFEASIEDFSAAINRLCKREFTEEALMLIPIMLSVGVYPDVQLYRVLGTALQKRNEFFYLPILQALAIKTGRSICYVWIEGIQDNVGHKQLQDQYSYANHKCLYEYLSDVDLMVESATVKMHRYTFTKIHAHNETTDSLVHLHCTHAYIQLPNGTKHVVR